LVLSVEKLSTGYEQFPVFLMKNGTPFIVSGGCPKQLLLPALLEIHFVVRDDNQKEPMFSYLCRRFKKGLFF
jgi:hypothetical protein